MRKMTTSKKPSIKKSNVQTNKSKLRVFAFNMLFNLSRNHCSKNKYTKFIKSCKI